MKKIILIGLLAPAWCYNMAQSLTPEDQYKTPPIYIDNKKEEVFSFVIINSSQSTFCYDIYSNGKMIIHQPSIPAIQGNKGFKTEKDAIKIAKIVISKIKDGIMPPTVSVEELKKQNVI